ncbi:discoidin domain-containing protein [Paenibacillus athensensis]|uniref:F5/8 type C domain-containing protein n=1 Tax=Paenibacillus athensensis TaxID=1967502 RepID=A0A4Y8PY88_9BACL|nr:discoidin domain-containing protein [Paenibacillus athensensis]MCD1259437.1 discoidin domain-containing protein [Paenibacillus athensensis]
MFLSDRIRRNAMVLFSLTALLLVSMPGLVQAQGSDNLALNPGGSGFPELSASYTCGCDSVWSTVNGIYSYTDNPRDRWTNYGSPNASDWIAVDFGAPQSFNQVNIYVFDDGGGVRPPASYEVQTWDGSDWTPVQNAVKTPATPGAALNTANFDPVTATKMRVVFTNGAAYSGVVELEVLDAGQLSYADVAAISAFGNAAGDQITLKLDTPMKPYSVPDASLFELMLPDQPPVTATEAVYDEADPEGRTVLLRFPSPVLDGQPLASVSIQAGALQLDDGAWNHPLGPIGVLTFHTLDQTGDARYAIDDIVRLIGDNGVQPDVNADAMFDQTDIRLLLEQLQPLPNVPDTD